MGSVASETPRTPQEKYTPVQNGRSLTFTYLTYRLSKPFETLFQQKSISDNELERHGRNTHMCKLRKRRR